MTDRIVSTPGTLGGKPRIVGHRISVKDVVIWYRRLGRGVAEIAEKYNLDEADVIAALDYYAAHRAEIDASTAAEEAMLQEVGQERRAANLNAPQIRVHVSGDGGPCTVHNFANTLTGKVLEGAAVIQPGETRTWPEGAAIVERASITHLPDYDRLRADVADNILSEIEDYCILLGTDALPFLRDYISKATAGWTKRPDPGLVEETHATPT